MTLIDNPRTQLWMTQFSDSEKVVALELLEKFVYVSSDEFQRDLSHLAGTTFSKNEKIAFFIERELPHHWYVLRKPQAAKIKRTRRLASEHAKTFSRKVRRPERMYKERLIKRGHGLRGRVSAYGVALPPVRSPRNDKQEIGSEGIVASIISKVCKQNLRHYFLHPSASTIRIERIRRFVIVTDFIGSGTRVKSMLQSLWSVKSVRSWFNGGFLRFSILCYSGTSPGFKAVSGHPTHPDIRKVRTCPTVHNSFHSPLLDEVRALCRSRFEDDEDWLGYEETGALIAFQHSCPNNVPAMFIKEGKSRQNPSHPLFPGRTTIHFAFHQDEASPNGAESRALATLRFPNIATAPAFQRASKSGRQAIVVTAALRRGHRMLDELSTVTGWPVWILVDALQAARDSGLVDETLRVTWSGLRLLKRLDAGRAAIALSHDKKPMYYPKSLRAPL